MKVRKSLSLCQEDSEYKLLLLQSLFSSHQLTKRSKASSLQEPPKKTRNTNRSIVDQIRPIPASVESRHRIDQEATESLARSKGAENHETNATSTTTKPHAHLQVACQLSTTSSQNVARPRPRSRPSSPSPSSPSTRSTRSATARSHPSLSSRPFRRRSHRRAVQRSRL